MPDSLEDVGAVPRPNIITCIGLDKVAGSGALRGFADRHLGPPLRMKLFGCACFLKDGRASVAPPTKPVTDRHGDATGKFAPMMAWDDTTLACRFSEAAVEVVASLDPTIFGDGP
jgi:hypothetical protein